jgi:hypothetical protein
LIAVIFMLIVVSLLEIFDVAVGATGNKANFAPGMTPDTSNRMNMLFLYISYVDNLSNRSIVVLQVGFIIFSAQ